jgi:hypothetical protein
MKKIILETKKFMDKFNNISLIVILQKISSLKSYIIKKLEIPPNSTLLEDLNFYLALSINLIFFNSIKHHFEYMKFHTNHKTSFLIRPEAIKTSTLLRLNLSEAYYENEFNNFGVVQILAKFLQYNKYLNHVDLSGNHIDLGLFEILLSAIKLKQLPESFELDLSSCNISDSCAQVLLNVFTTGLCLQNLKINLWNNHITSKGLKYLIKCAVILSQQGKRLQFILQKNNLDKESYLSFLSSEENLRVLDNFDLSFNNLNSLEKESHILSFVNLSQTIFLDKLNLSNSKLKNEGLFYLTESLGKYYFVKSLILQSNEIDHEGCKFLFNKLTKIFEKQEKYDKVRSKYLSEKQLEENNYCLKTIDLSYNNITKGEISIAEFLFKNYENSIENLILSSCNLSSIYLLYLAKGVFSNKCLKVLDLSNNPSIEEVLEEFLNALNGNNFSIVEEENLKYEKFVKSYSQSLKDSSLEFLNLSHNKLNDQSLKFLSEFLIKNKSIKNIILKFSNFSDEGVKVLVESLKYNKSLQELNLSDNQTFSLPNLFNLLAKYPSNLESLKVSYCNKLPFSCEDFLNFLIYGQHDKLKKLDISYNFIGSSKFEIIMSRLQSANRKIDFLNLSSNSLSQNDFNNYIVSTGNQDLFFTHINLKSNKVRISDNYISVLNATQLYVFELSWDIDLNLISFLQKFPKIIII